MTIWSIANITPVLGHGGPGCPCHRAAAKRLSAVAETEVKVDRSRAPSQTG